MAGQFLFEREHYKIRVQAASLQGIVSTDKYNCKQEIPILIAINYYLLKFNAFCYF